MKDSTTTCGCINQQAHKGTKMNAHFLTPQEMLEEAEVCYEKLGKSKLSYAQKIAELTEKKRKVAQKEAEYLSHVKKGDRLRRKQDGTVYRVSKVMPAPYSVGGFRVYMEKGGIVYGYTLLRDYELVD